MDAPLHRLISLAAPPFCLPHAAWLAPSLSPRRVMASPSSLSSLTTLPWLAGWPPRRFVVLVERPSIPFSAATPTRGFGLLPHARGVPPLQPALPRGRVQWRRAHGHARGHELSAGNGRGQRFMPVADTGRGRGRGRAFWVAGAGKRRHYPRAPCPLPSFGVRADMETLLLPAHPRTTTARPRSKLPRPVPDLSPGARACSTHAAAGTEVNDGR